MFIVYVNLCCLKFTVQISNVDSNDPSFIEEYARFTTVVIKALSNQLYKSNIYVFLFEFD